jgi:muramoyltetrapeptide carboxypeptidase
MSMNRSVIKPKRLVKGDTVALVAPASPQKEDEDIRMAIETIESLGFVVWQGEHLYDRHGYLAGKDRDRAADLNAAFAEESVDGIFALCGGYGSPRILPYLDYELIRANPKVLMGYSDITALLNGIHHRTGMVTFHGPIAAQAFSPYTLGEYKKVVMHGEQDVLLGAPPAIEHSQGQVERKNRLTTIVGGTTQGRLIGGNLSLVATLCGTPYSPDYEGRILLLEDVGEATYRLDRMLTQLWLSGGLDKLAGIVIGKFSGCKTSASWPWQFTVEQVIRDRCEALGIPALRGLMIGHVPEQTTLPIGCMAELDADAGTLRLLEAGVV